METKIAKVSDNGRKFLVDLKKGVTRKLLSKHAALNSPINNVVKKRKLDGAVNKSGSQFNLSLLKYYSNFTRSGIPQRVMFYQNGEWNNFPHDFITSIKKDLQVKKAALEVEYNSHKFILDFLHMVKLDGKTGYSQPLAWIDESGKCFFPELFSGHDENQDSGLAYQDIKLQLEIEVKESDRSKFNGCSRDSNAFVKQIHINKKIASGCYDSEVKDSCGKPSDVGESKKREINNVPNIEYGYLGGDDVRKLFYMGMGSSVSAEIVDIYRGSNSLMQARLELFFKQVEITNKYRGDANVRYAWFATTKEALPSTMTYGIGIIDNYKMKSPYGVGVHLSPANCTLNSASYCDIDENGLRHMLFCRIIMGKMELIHEGSKQFHPSDDEFDSGVNDLQNPSHYIVWNMNKNTHIYPEFAVSFKAFSDGAAGIIAKSASKLDISGVTACSPEPLIHSQLDTSPAHLVPVEKVQEKVSNLGSSSTRIPKSPWVAFPTLLAAVSNNVHPEGMKLLQIDYNLLQSKKINRQEFIRKLRLIVGDPLLRSAITDLQSKEKGGNEPKLLAEKGEFAADKETMANESKQATEIVEVAVDKVMPNFGSKAVA